MPGCIQQPTAAASVGGPSFQIHESVIVRSRAAGRRVSERSTPMPAEDGDDATGS